MVPSGPYHREFIQRLGTIPVHGLGLSVDIHAPDLASLRRSLQERQVPPAYLEVFRTTPTALASTRKEVGAGLLTYHGEGLWITQPEMAHSASFRQEISEAAEQLVILQSAWLNHECATKYLAGYYYGTYLPPLYTPLSAKVVADNTRLIQRLLDQQCRLANGSTPLVLLEMPPLTYFVAGTMSIPNFFRVVSEQAPCGLVLDVGHLWTVFRYSGAHRAMSLTRFVDEFLNEFPMDRVVEIHVAGLAVHASHRALAPRLSGGMGDDALPAWIDDHAAPIPTVLFEMLDQILCHPALTSLKGLALEVDTKPVELIVDEFAEFSTRYGPLFSRPSYTEAELDSEVRSLPEGQRAIPDMPILQAAYDRYARVLAGKTEPVGMEWSLGTAGIQDLDLYRSVYLPYEILHWGGKVEDMFVESCRRLREREVSLDEFVAFWFREPRPFSGIYDFFLLKVERFVEFVREVAPELQGIAETEAQELRRAYRFANEPAVPV
ncbi:MAG: hypothetical protein OJF51_002826 [Nitrospira sp.]|jgi:uncharacterized protein (UPF0276 family)|nr:MAG: hypothetical protein OJF51_002826 [Nitrospira sp.]